MSGGAYEYMATFKDGFLSYSGFTSDPTITYGNKYFDKYLKSKDKKLLDDGVVYCMVDISNLLYINGEYSRTVGDEIIKMFTNYLKEAFGKSKTEYYAITM